jgi:hypothetical protein
VPGTVRHSFSTLNIGRYALAVLLDSEKKCHTFINGMVIAENTVNTTGDITATILSGLASVFSKSAVNANIYAKASVANFQTALQQSYGQEVARPSS